MPRPSRRVLRRPTHHAQFKAPRIPALARPAPWTPAPAGFRWTYQVQSGFPVQRSEQMMRTEAQNAALLARLGPAPTKGARTKPKPGTA